MRNTILFFFAVLLSCGACQAGLFSGSSSFTSLPISQVGSLTNNLVLTDNANGFVVSGQVLINVPPGSFGGSLVTWTVDRPLDATYGSGTLITTSVLDGFSTPPAGTFGTTKGFAQSMFSNYLGTLTSLSDIFVLLTNGAATWSNITVNSATFPYTSGGVNYLHQTFVLDAHQISGAGGTWIVDVPITTTATVIPEPSTLALGLLGFGAVVLAARFKRR